MVNWTGDKDAQLLVGIFEYQNISFSQGLLKHLADKIGEGCTPKAVSHRLNNIKARGKPGDFGKASGSGPSTPAKGARASTETPKSKSKGSATSAGTGKRARGRPPKNTYADTEEPQDDDEPFNSPTFKRSKSTGVSAQAGTKRGRSTAFEEDGDGFVDMDADAQVREELEEQFRREHMNKKVKLEPVEEEYLREQEGHDDGENDDESEEDDYEEGCDGLDNEYV